MLSKDKFVSIMKKMEAQESIDSKISKAVSEAFDCWAVSYNHGRLTSTILELLSEIFDIPNRDLLGENDIEYFMYELDYGKKWKPGMITEKDGTDIDFSDAGKLYDYLTKEKKTSNEIVVGC